MYVIPSPYSHHFAPECRTHNLDDHSRQYTRLDNQPYKDKRSYSQDTRWYIRNCIPRSLHNGHFTTLISSFQLWSQKFEQPLQTLLLSKLSDHLTCSLFGHCFSHASSSELHVSEHFFQKSRFLSFVKKILKNSTLTDSQMQGNLKITKAKSFLFDENFFGLL